MNNTVGDVYTEELAELFQQQGQLLYDGQHSLCLTTPCLHFLQKRFSAIQEGSTDPVPVKFAVLHCLQGCLAKVVSLKLITDKQMTLVSTATLNLEPFRALHTLVLKKVPLVSVTGLQRLRSQLRVLVIQRCRVDNIDDVIVRCGGDDSTSFVWDSLRELDLSSNLVSQLGDSLQYLPCMEKVNFSNNYITSEGWESAPLVEGQSSTIGGQGPSNKSVVNASGVSITNSYEGIVCLEKVTFLHLGFNKLRVVPRFASKAKYTLTVLNLRNNQLDTIEGVHELDRLAELDLTDNLIMKHSCLSPLKNLHHLSLLNLQGNPLCYHPKHRLKTAQYLSNLIDKNAFRLEGKKLSATEKKEISNFLTHYSGNPSFVIRSSAPLPVDTPSQHSYVGMASTATEHVQGTTPTQRFSKALSSDVLQEEKVAAKKPRRKKSSKSVKIFDSDENQSPEDTAGKEELTVGSVPLMNEKHLNKIKLVRKQLEADWIKTINAVERPCTTDISSNQSFVASAQTPPSPKHSTPIRKLSLKKRDSIEQSVGGKTRERKSRGRRRKRGGVPSVGAECEGVSGGEGEEVNPMSLTPVDRVPTPSHIEGEYFLVERYESDVEDDDSLPTGGRSLGSSGRGWPVQGSRDTQMLIVLTERFLEEQTAKGKHIDRWDVNSLLEVSIDKRPWKKGKAGQANVLFLKFNLDRRDRRKREYVLLEEGINDDLLGHLNSIVEQNQATLSVENKLECLHCQRIFDKSRAQEEVSSETTPLPLGSHKNRPLSTLVCPFCQSQVLQIATSLSSKSYKGAPAYSPSLRQTPLEPTPPSNSRNGNVVTPSNQQKAGFEISPSHPSQEDVLKSTITTEINGEAIFNASTDDSPQKNELQSSVDSIEFAHSSGGLEKHSFDLTGSVKLSSDPIGDLSPWKPDNSRSRPRAGAVCVSTEQASTLQDSSEQHHLLHKDVRKNSPEIARKNSTEVTQTRSEVSPTNETEVVENLSANPFDANPFDSPLPPPLSSSYDPSKRDTYFHDVTAKVPEIEISTSVPAGAQFHTYMADNAPTLSESDKSMTESHSHNRSKSVDYHPRKTLNTTPPSQRKKYPDPYPSRDEDHTHRHTHSLGSVKEGESLRTDSDNNPASYSSSKKSSLVSLDDRDSPRLNRPDVEHSSQGYSSSESGKKSKQISRDKQHASGDTGNMWENLFSSGESVKRASFDRGYSSSEASQRLSNSRGYLSSEGNKQRQHRVRSQDDSKDSRKAHSDNASRRRGDAGSSSEEQRLTKTFYKEEDPTYIESNLNLFLDMEIFNLDKKEEFQMVFRTPVVQYGRTTEMPALVVISNLSLYIFRVIAPENSVPSKWLELVSNHLLRRLVYIDIGVGYQLLRLEFRTDQLACYSFLLRDEDKCTIISTKLAFIVSDVAKSSFKTVGVCPFSMETIRYPKRALKEVLLVDYEQLSGRSTPTRGRHTPTRGGRHTPTLGPASRPGSSLARSHDDDELVLYRLVHKRASARSQASGPTPVSLIITKTTIFLARENFTHWPLPRIHELPSRDSLRPPYSEVQQRSITDIDQIVLDRDQATQVTIRFFKECMLEGEDRYWLLVMRNVSCVEKLVTSVSALWKMAFQTDLPIIHK